MTINILMITHNRPEAVRRSLPRLLDSCGEDARVWLWQNGNHEETLEVVRGFAQDPRVERFHHSPENLRLREPTNWLWSESRADYLSKVDDDCLVPDGWLKTLRTAHEDHDAFGVIGSWRHYPDEFVPELAKAKIQSFPGGHQLMRNHWVQGSGYLVKRRDVERFGLLGEDDSFPKWCLRGARAGLVNGFYYPFLFEDHMDDPRSEYALIRTDADLNANPPLSALNNSVTTVAEWEARNRREARLLQGASLDLREYFGWRRTVRKVKLRIRGLVRGRRLMW